MRCIGIFKNKKISDGLFRKYVENLGQQCLFNSGYGSLCEVYEIPSRLQKKKKQIIRNITLELVFFPPRCQSQPKDHNDIIYLNYVARTVPYESAMVFRFKTDTTV